MKLSPRSEALAYRIWAHCGPLGWNTTIADVADALEAPYASVRVILARKGWIRRLRTTKLDCEQLPVHYRSRIGDGPGTVLDPEFA
jgi:hypothetical protein